MNVTRFERPFALLGELTSHPDGRTLVDLSAALAVPTSSVHDLLRAMTEAGLVSLRADRRYAIGPKFTSLALRVVDSVSVRQVARPHLEELVDATGDDVYLAVQTGHRVLYVDRYEAASTVNVHIRLGEPLYLHSTAAGKLFAAYDRELAARVLRGKRLARFTDTTITDPQALATEYERIREAEVSVSREESIEGMVGISVPVRDPRGGLAAAVHVSGLRGRMTEERIVEILPTMRAVAAAIERELGTGGDASERRAA